MKQPNSSARFSAFPLSACACAAALLILSACGGGGTGNSGSDGNGGATGGTPPVAAKTALIISKAEVAQTHLIPPEGLNWSLKNSAPLTLAAQRDALVLLRLGSADAQNPVVEVLKDGAVLGKLALTPPAQLPPSEGLDTPYGSDLWSLILPANLVQPGISLRVSASNYDYSKPVAMTVGANTELQMQILPFVLFGATNANTGLNLDSERVMHMDAAAQQQAAATWPASQVKVSNHPLGQFVADTMVIPPKAGAAAYVVSSHHELRDGAHVIDTTNDLAYQIHLANGDMAMNRVTYASIIAIDKSIKSTKQLAWIGGGVSVVGSGVGAGGNTYGLLLHETGHAMSLGHSAGEYNDLSGSKFPYIAGSIKGSVWGFNMATREFRNPLMAPTAPRFTWCRTNNAYQLDEKGRCYRKDPMDDADSGSDPKYTFSLFSDFNMARIQRWIQEQIKVDAASATGLSGWDSSRAAWTDYTPKTSNFGAYGIKQNLPLSVNVPVHTIVATYSNAATAGASRFYDPVTHQGNLIETIDPTVTAQLSKIFPYTQNGSNPEYMWYCHTSGCDYTLRVTFSDGSQIYRVLKEGFRKYSYPETFDIGVNDPLNGRSQRNWAINIPAKNGAQIRKLELLDTPLVWRLTPAQISSARVVMSSSY